MEALSLPRMLMVVGFVLSGCGVRCEDKMMVSHSGKDVSTCGNDTQPCATLRYALSIRPNISHIYMNSTGGPYLAEVGATYMVIQHNFTLTGLQGPQSRMAVIQCPQGDSNHSKLFLFNGSPHRHGRIKVNIEGNGTVFGAGAGLGASPPAAADIVIILSIQNSAKFQYHDNLCVRNCQSSDDDYSGVMEISNTRLQIDNSEFSSNRMLLRHSQTAQDNCSSVKLLINSCNFKNDLDLAGQTLYEPAIQVAGCGKVDLTVSDSQFQTAPVRVKARLNTKVFLNNVAFRGVGLRGSSLDITLSPGNNTVTLRHCNVSGHLASRSSPVSISADAQPQMSKVALDSVHFHDNHRVKTRGGALSVFARFTRSTPVQLNVSLLHCSFVNNSVDDLQVAGAVYISSVASLTFQGCRFLSNNATEGGAMYLYSAADVQFVLTCEFRSNFAVNQHNMAYASRGGAVFAMSSELVMIDTTFSDNSAVYSGSSVFATDAVSLHMTRCQLTEPASEQLVRGPANTILSVSTGPPRTSSAVVRLKECLLQCVVERKHLLMYISGPATLSNTTTVTCLSDALTVHRISQPAAQYRAGYELEQIAVWSEMACPTGTYVINRTTQQSVNSPLGGAADQCYDCPEHAFCDGSSVHPDYNYCDVRNRGGRVQIVLCPDGYCQPGDNHTSTGCCSEGRSGLMCTNCDDSHVASLQFTGHVTCQPEHASCIDYSGATVAIICFTLFYVIILLALMSLCTRQRHHQLSIRSDAQTSTVNLDDVRPSTSAETRATTGHVTSTRSLIGCVMALVFYYQLVPSVYPRLMTSSWPLDRAIQLSVSLFHLYPAALASGRGFCLELLTGDPSSLAVQRYFFTMSIYWSQLVVIALFFFVLSGVFMLTRGPFTEQNIKMLVTYFLPAYMFCQVFSNVPLLRASLQSLHCVAYNGSSVLFTDAMTNCYSSWQIFSILYLIVCVVPLCLVVDTGAFLLSRGRLFVSEYLVVCLLPLYGLVWIPVRNLMSRRGTSTRDEFEVDETTPEGLRSVSSHSIVTVQSVVIKPFRSYFASPFVDVGWMTVILVRNCLICLLSSLLGHQPAARAIVVAVVCIGFTLDHIASRGYAEKAANHVDTAALAMLSLLSLAGVYVSAVYEAGDSQWRPTVIDWLCRLIVSLPIVVIIILIVIVIIRAVVRRAKRCRRARPL